ncbi:DUF4145 domain-containing protein [Psychrobacter namhaensis]|uniref:DUF4145 domain-containing protein n=1 Tax=Psychrobacter namhaensis TaxID=292734 RepID=UPI0018DF2C24|nr:DUF4145 domain-containing protein [Psychrobacter namhaensis]
MNRTLYKQKFTLDNSPDYNCPKCNIGLLRIQKDSFKEYTTCDLDEMQKHPDFEPEWIEYIFNCVFECNNDRCEGKVLCTGHGSVGFDIDVDDYGQQYQEWDDYYRPLFFHPNLNLIIIPEDTPTDIKKILNQSFELFFTSPSAAANLVRIAIEGILTDQGVNLYSKKDGSKKISLHSRIEDHLPDKYQTIKEHLEAVKWLGNAGSHSGEELTPNNTMDAYELIEYILSQVYAPPTNNLNRLAQNINKSRGPIKSRILSN